MDQHETSSDCMEQLPATERAELEQLVSVVVGHDLRNPLAAISACVGVLQKMGPLDEPRQRCLEVIAGSTARLTRQLADLSDLLLCAGQGIQLRPAPAHLETICESVLQGLRAAHPDRPLSVVGRGDGMGLWDAVRLAQALRNLVSNALRYSEPGSAVEVRWDGLDPAEVSLEVESRGPTIAPEALAAIFRPSRAGRPPSAEREGLGIGVFMATHLARAHGGKARAISADGRTTFRLQLPRHARAQPRLTRAL